MLPVVTKKFRDQKIAPMLHKIPHTVLLKNASHLQCIESCVSAVEALPPMPSNSRSPRFFGGLKKKGGFGSIKTFKGFPRSMRVPARRPERNGSESFFFF